MGLAETTVISRRFFGCCPALTFPPFLSAAFGAALAAALVTDPVAATPLLADEAAAFEPVPEQINQEMFYHSTVTMLSQSVNENFYLHNLPLGIFLGGNGLAGGCAGLGGLGFFWA